jgi:putative ABC transport system permease protein
MIFRLAIKELRHAQKTLGAVIFILLVGFVGPLAVSALRGSVATYMQERARQVLSADVSVSALRPFKESELQTVRETVHPLRTVEEVEFVTMARGPKATTLVEVRAVDPDFPIFGGFRLKTQNQTQESNQSLPAPAHPPVSAAALNERPIAWVYPEVLEQLELKAGQVIHLGSAEFEVQAALDDAPGAARFGSGLAPRVFIARRFAEATELLRTGSQVTHRLYLSLAKGIAAEDAAVKIKEALKDPDIFLRTPDDSVQGFERFFKFFNLYLVVIAMMVFALAWSSAFSILQVFLEDRLKNAAILLTSGASRAFTAGLYALEVLTILLIALSGATAVVALLVKLAPLGLGSLLPIGFVIHLGSNDLLAALAVAVLSAVAFLLPAWAKLYSLPLGRLLSESSLAPLEKGRITLATRVSYALVLLIFAGLSSWLMGSFGDAFRLVAGLLGVLVLGWAFGRGLFSGLFRVVRRRPGLTRLVATNLARGRFGTSLGFLTLLFVALVMNLVPHLLRSVVAEVRPSEGRDVPALFLFNIPESSVEPVKELIARRGAELRFLSPLILARLTNVNGVPPEADFFQRFPVRISYRAERVPSEKLVEGRDVHGNFDPAKGGEPAISMEQRFAERNGFHLGDRLEFDVQGVPVTGRIANFRSVKWTEFHPNFFITFQPGVLEDAPKTFIANINLSSSGPAREAEKLGLQYDLIKTFPDLSVIDIGRTVERVLEIANSVIGPLETAAAVAIAMSFFILLGVVTHGLGLRREEFEIERLLGADTRLLRRLVVSEFAITAVLAWACGAGGAVAITAYVAVKMLDVPMMLDLRAIISSGFLVVLVTALMARRGFQKIWVHRLK